MVGFAGVKASVSGPGDVRDLLMERRDSEESVEVPSELHGVVGDEMES